MYLVLKVPNRKIGFLKNLVLQTALGHKLSLRLSPGSYSIWHRDWVLKWVAKILILFWSEEELRVHTEFLQYLWYRFSEPDRGYWNDISLALDIYFLQMKHTSGGASLLLPAKCLNCTSLSSPCGPMNFAILEQWSSFSRKNVEIYTQNPMMMRKFWLDVEIVITISNLKKSYKHDLPSR